MNDIKNAPRFIIVLVGDDWDVMDTHTGKYYGKAIADTAQASLPRYPKGSPAYAEEALSNLEYYVDCDGCMASPDAWTTEETVTGIMATQWADEPFVL